MSILWDITAIDGAPPTLTLKLLFEDPVDDAFKIAHTFSVTQNATGKRVYHIGCGDTPDGKFLAPRIPRVKWKLRVTPSNSNGATYSMSKFER